MIRDYRWESSPLGPPKAWTPSLRTTVELLLAAEAQIVMFCGPHFAALVNDAYAPTIGDKHRRATHDRFRSILLPSLAIVEQDGAASVRRAPVRDRPAQPQPSRPLRGTDR